MLSLQDISIATSPQAFAFYGTIIIGAYTKDPLSVMVGTLFYALWPSLVMVYYYMTVVTDVEAMDRKVRYKIYAATLPAYLAGAAVASILGMTLLAKYGIMYFIVIIIMMTINFKKKASTHMAGIIGPTTFLALETWPSIAILYILAPLMALQRIKVGAHTKSELAIGAAIGLVITTILWWIL